jgi:hypothetical protein
MKDTTYELSLTETQQWSLESSVLGNEDENQDDLSEVKLMLRESWNKGRYKNKKTYLTLTLSEIELLGQLAESEANWIDIHEESSALRGLSRKCKNFSRTDQQREQDANKVKNGKLKAQLRKKQNETILAEAKVVWRLMREWHGGKPLPEIKIYEWVNRTRRSWAYTSDGKVHLRVEYADTDKSNADTWATLVHELAHIACPPIRDRKTRRDDAHHKVFYKCIRDVWIARWNAPINFGVLSGNRWGYTVDRIIEKQGEGYVDWKLPQVG